MQTTGVILAGGKSSRMGTDKAALEVDGEPLLTRTIRLLFAATGPPPLVVGREESDPSALFVPDDAPDLGPIGGLRTALRLAEGRNIVVVACDLPALTQDAVRWLLAQPFGTFGTVTRNADQLEPLFAVYTPACAPLLDANIRAGKRSLHALIEAGGNGFAFADAPEGIASALVNVNTPQEWARFAANTSV